MDNKKKKYNKGQWWKIGKNEFKWGSTPPGIVRDKIIALNEAMADYNKGQTSDPFEDPFGGGFTPNNVPNYSVPNIISGGYYPPNYNPSRNPQYPESPKDLRLVLFYGFNGMLAHKFSITGMSHEEMQARMEFAKNKVPYKILYMEEFQGIIRQFPDEFQEITFDDAMNIIRIGIDTNKQEEFEDAEVDEFDDNCVEACKPGEHVCGK